MNRSKYIAASTIVLALIAFFAWYGLKPSPMIIQGEVVAVEAKAAAKLTARVREILVKEGEMVKAGQLLLRLESPEIEAKYKQANAARRAAAAQNAQALSGARRETIEAAKSTWLKAEAAAELAAKTLERSRRLFDAGVIPEQKMDEAETNKKAAELTARAARANYDMALTGARDEEKNAASALFDRASGAVSEVESFLSETELRAPIDGEVTEIMPNTGELISAGYPSVIITDLSDIHVRINLREDMLTEIRMGSIINAGFPALGSRKIKLRVTYIAPMGEFAAWRATRTSGDFDMKTFEIKAEPVSRVEGLRPGMTAVINWPQDIEKVK